MRISDWSSDVCSSDLLRREAEILVEVARRRRRAEAVDAEAQAVQPGIAFPAEGRAGFDRDAQYAAGQNVRAIIVRLRVEARGAGHRHHVGADPPGLEPFGDAAPHLDLGARGDTPRIGRASWRARVCQYL